MTLNPSKSSDLEQPALKGLKIQLNVIDQTAMYAFVLLIVLWNWSE